MNRLTSLAALLAFTAAPLALTAALTACGGNDGGNGIIDAAALPPDAMHLVPDAMLLPDAMLPPDAMPPLPADGGITVACTLQEVTPLVQCALQNCANAGANIVTCVAINCFQDFTTISPGCLQCVLSAASADPATIAAACVSGLPAFPDAGPVADAAP